MAHHVAAHAWTVVLEVGNAERTEAERDRPTHLVGLRALEGFDPRLELVVGPDQDTPEITEPRVGVVSAFVPALRTAIEGVVVGLPRVLDE